MTQEKVDDLDANDPLSTLSAQEQGQAPEPYMGPEDADIESQDHTVLARRLSMIMQKNDDIVPQLESLTRVLSTRTFKDGKLNIDPANFDLRILLNTVVTEMKKEGIELNRTGVLLKDVTTKGVDASASFNPSVEEIIRSVIALPMILRKLRKPPIRNLIENVDCLVRPGEMLLVVGRPGSGCSTLLKTIAGEIDQFKGVDGELTYDGASQQAMLKNFKNQVIYNPERKC
jgi:ATP-binding cassette subfamily G (WHITE) protein 2 (SNQ2)